MTAQSVPVRDNLMRLLDRIEAETGDGDVSLRDVLGILGPRACTPMLLVPSLVLVSPASAVPGVPSLLPLLVGLVARVDPLINERLTWLADKSGNLPELLICATISFFMPLIEFVPFLTSILASAIALFAAGMFARDGLFMLLGYALVAGSTTLVVEAVQAVAT